MSMFLLLLLHLRSADIFYSNTADFYSITTLSDKVYGKVNCYLLRLKSGEQSSLFLEPFFLSLGVI